MRSEEAASGDVDRPVLDRIPGQEGAMVFLRRAAGQPHHAYLLAGPEGGGKQLAARSFAAALLCAEGGCGWCRACSLVLEDRHPNVFVVEPEGRGIHVETIREEIWHPAYRTAPEPGRKVFLIREADRLNPAAADALLKVLEEPPADTVIVLLSARPHELPDTIVSRCHVVTFLPLAEAFVVETLEAEGVDPARAALAGRLSGGNLGRARRMAVSREGLEFREVGLEALAKATEGPDGGLAAAEVVLAAAERYRKDLREGLEEQLAPFLDEQGRPDDAFRGVIRRLEERHKRQVRRAERDYVDWVLLAISAVLRDRLASAVGASSDVVINLDLDPDEGGDVPGRIARATRGLSAVEEARAALAEELNLNPRLVLERAFLGFGSARVG